MAASRLDLAILKEIVRVVQEKSRVPDKVRILKRDYVLTYLEDHRQRMEEALRRFDPDRVNMLFGQLASKVKYQLVRISTRRQAVPSKSVPSKAVASKPLNSKSKQVPKPKAKAATRNSPAAQPKRTTRGRAAAAARKPAAKKRTSAR